LVFAVGSVPLAGAVKLLDLLIFTTRLLPLPMEQNNVIEFELTLEKVTALA
jgi:hypothetical protein